MWDANVLTSFLSGATGSSCDKRIESPIVGRTWTIILKSSLSLCVTLKHIIKMHSHKQSFPFVSSYCFFWSTVKTVTHEKKKTNKRSETRDALREGSGSQLRVSITVSHHSDWWLTAFATLLITAKETNIKAQHALDPTRSFLQLIVDLLTSATL